MPRKVTSLMDERQTFCEAVRRPERNMAALCREYKISRTTGYKWLKRTTDAEAQGLPAGQAVQELPRRPHTSPSQTPEAMQTAVLVVRAAHPTWGGRKLHHALRQQLAGSEGGSAASAAASVPAASTITAILRRTVVTMRIGPIFGPLTVESGLSGTQRRARIDEMSDDMMRQIARLFPPERRGPYAGQV